MAILRDPLIQELEAYRVKMKREVDPVFDVGVRAVEAQFIIAAARNMMHGLETARIEMAKVMEPFLPAPEPEPPEIPMAPRYTDRTWNPGAEPWPDEELPRVMRSNGG